MQTDAAHLLFVLFAAGPLNEPAVSNGPFVTNTAEQLAHAVADFRTGRMGHRDPTPGAAWLRRRCAGSREPLDPACHRARATQRALRADGGYTNCGTTS